MIYHIAKPTVIGAGIIHNIIGRLSSKLLGSDLNFARVLFHHPDLEFPVIFKKNVPFLTHFFV
jgi:hypothetical protein